MYIHALVSEPVESVRAHTNARVHTHTHSIIYVRIHQ